MSCSCEVGATIGRPLINRFAVCCSMEELYGLTCGRLIAAPTLLHEGLTVSIEKNTPCPSRTGDERYASYLPFFGGFTIFPESQ